MNIHEYQKVFEIEESYWWFVGKWRLVSILIQEMNLSKNSRILDLGCGCGLGLLKLSEFGNVVGMDREHEALQFCQQRKATPFLIQAAAERLPFKQNAFDLIVALDLLEHIEDDAGLLEELSQICSPGTLVILSVPCHPSLYSEHDIALHHIRRYRKRELQEKITAAGFRTRKMTFFNMALLPPIAAMRVFKKLFGSKDRPRSDDYFPVPKFINVILTRLLTLEALISKRISLPAGLSLYAVVQKK